MKSITVFIENKLKLKANKRRGQLIDLGKENSWDFLSILRRENLVLEYHLSLYRDSKRRLSTSRAEATQLV